MDTIEYFLEVVKSYVWGAPLLILLFGTGLYLTYLLGGVQFRYLFYAIQQVFAPKKAGAKGDISHFQSLMTTLAGAIGTGSIVGVATAITVGGLGALFWMWVTALFGMATKYSESLLAVKYRVIDKKGEMVGGPMEYMDRGLGWKKMALFFSIIGCFATITTGNLVQANSIAESLDNIAGINPWVTGSFLAALVSLVILGGVKSIGKVAGVLVPLMALFYIGGGTIILAYHYAKIPEALSLILSSAFTGQAAFGGFAGSSMVLAIEMGVSRSVFSSEAGFGIPSIAAASAKTDNAGRQAMVAMTGSLVSTVVVCTITGLVIAVSGLLGTTTSTGETINGATLAIEAFASAMPIGRYVVSMGLILFAFSTLIAWAFYGEKCCEYILGETAVLPYRILYNLAIIPGAVVKLSIVWHLADICNGLMVMPNLLALLGLSSVICAETKSFLKIADVESQAV